MLYKAKIAACSEIHAKHINEKRAPCRTFQCYTWWYLKLRLGLEPKFIVRCKGVRLTRRIKSSPIHDHASSLYVQSAYNWNVILNYQTKTKHGALLMEELTEQEWRLKQREKCTTEEDKWRWLRYGGEWHCVHYSLYDQVYNYHLKILLKFV
jgi:hypothetical protein